MCQFNPYQKSLAHQHLVNATQEKLCRGYLIAYRHHDFSLVTIKEICQAVGVARTSFYRYFDNTAQLRNLIEDNFVAGFLSSSEELTDAVIDSCQYRRGLKSTISFLQQNREVFNLLLVERPSRSFMDKYVLSINYKYYHLCHENPTNLAVVAGGIIGFFRYRLSQNLPLDDPAVIDTYVKYMRCILQTF